MQTYHGKFFSEKENAQTDSASPYVLSKTMVSQIQQLKEICKITPIISDYSSLNDSLISQMQQLRELYKIKPIISDYSNLNDSLVSQMQQLRELYKIKPIISDYSSLNDSLISQMQQLRELYKIKPIISDYSNLNDSLLSQIQKLHINLGLYSSIIDQYKKSVAEMHMTNITTNLGQLNIPTELLDNINIQDAPQDSIEIPQPISSSLPNVRRHTRKRSIKKAEKIIQLAHNKCYKESLICILKGIGKLSFTQLTKREAEKLFSIIFPIACVLPNPTITSLLWSIVICVSLRWLYLNGQDN